MPTEFDKKEERPQSQQEMMQNLFALLGSLGVNTNVPSDKEIIARHGKELRYLEDGVNLIFEVYDPELCSRIRSEMPEWCDKYKQCISCRIDYWRKQKGILEDEKPVVPTPTKGNPVVMTADNPFVMERKDDNK